MLRVLTLTFLIFAGAMFLYIAWNFVRYFVLPIYRARKAMKNGTLRKDRPDDPEDRFRQAKRINPDK